IAMLQDPLAEADAPLGSAGQNRTPVPHEKVWLGGRLARALASLTSALDSPARPPRAPCATARRRRQARSARHRAASSPSSRPPIPAFGRSQKGRLAIAPADLRLSIRR